MEASGANGGLQQQQAAEAELQSHLAAEEAHSRRALAAAGVSGLAGRLLGEMRDVWVGTQGAGGEQVRVKARV